MKTSPQTVAAIALLEGTRLHPYNDLNGNATNGIGHLLHKGPCDGTEPTLTEAEALDQFSNDLYSKAEIFVNRFVKAPLTQNQFDALSDFCYNEGCGSLQKVVSETGLDRPFEADYVAVPGHLMSYNKIRKNGVLVPCPGLTNRRQFEIDLWNKV